MADVRVHVASANTRSLTELCIRSMERFAGYPFELYVGDVGSHDGSIEMLATSIAGRTLAGPNDLAFGPDGRLWFTESGTEQDDRFPQDERAAGALYVAMSSGKLRP